MARISDLELERLKREVSLERLVTARGVALERRGESLVGRCPFHEDKTPSLAVTPKKNLWHCLGACRTGGTVIDWVMKSEGVSFRHAVELLRDGGFTPGTRVVKATSVPRLPPPFDFGATDEQLLEQVASYYQQRLVQTLVARDYLKGRGLDSAELLAHFRLGFADRTLGLRLPDANRKSGAEIRGRLQRLGLMRESGHEHFNGCVVVPLCDAAGGVRGLYGRKLTPNLRPGTALHLYLPGQHRAVFNEAALASSDTVVLCEAVLDALSFWAAGFRAVTCSYGVDGFTPLHLEALKKHGVRNVLLAFDRDDAGDAGAARVAKRLFSEGLECWRVLFPRGMDANEYACKVQPADKSLGVALRQAEYMGPEKKARPAPLLLPSTAKGGRPPPGAAAAGAPALVASTPASVPVAESSCAAPASIAAGGLRRPPAAVDVSTDPGPAGFNEPLHAPVPEVAENSRAAPASTANGGRPPPGAAAAGAPAPAASTPAPVPEVAELSPAAPAPAPTSTSDDEATFEWGARRYRVRGLGRPQSSDSLRVNLLVSSGEAFHVDTLDLYQAKARSHFVAVAAAELRLEAEVVKRDVAQLLLQLETLLEKRAAERAGPKVPALTEEQREAALAFLRAPNLLERVVADFGRCGVVGEESNALVGYLAAISRKLEEPLAVLIQSSSAAGKSSLMEAVLAFVPSEEKVKYSAMTGQSLFYMGDADLKHKVLAVVEEEGAARASYALKLLQSEGELTIASTGKNPHTGKLETHEYRVEGPTQLFLTTTASELDEELLNRCLVLTVDEEREQTRAIHQQQRQRRTLEGLLKRKQREAVLALHQNAQRLLRPLAVVNPYAPQLSFPDGRTRARRDFPKYLTLISSIALLRQYQRPVKVAQAEGGAVEYVEVTLDDVEVANRLAAAVLGRSVDELPPQARRLLHQVQAWAQKRAAEEKRALEAVRFSRRQLREAFGWRNSQLALHLARLVDFELLVVHRGGHGALVYSLDVAGDVAAPVLTGLSDAGGLAHAYDAPASGVAGQLPAPFRGASGAGAGSSNPEAALAFASKAPASGFSARALPPLPATGASKVQVAR